MTDEQAPEIEGIHWDQSPADQQDFLQRFLLRQEVILDRRRTGLRTAQQAFASMVKNEIAPRLRELGLKGSGQKFRLPPETHLHSHRERLGFLSRGRDHWWEVPADGPTLKIAGEVIHDISEFGIPWLRAQTQADFTIPWLRRHAKA